MLPSALMTWIRRLVPTERGRLGLSGVSWYTLATVSGGLLQLVAVPFVTRSVSVGVYGQFGVLTVATSLLMLLVDFGVGTATVRQLGVDPDPAAQRTVTSTFLWSQLLLALPLGVLIALSGNVVPWESFAGPGSREVTGMVALWLVLWVLTSALLDALRGHERHLAAATTLALQAIGRAAAMGVLVVHLRLGLWGLAASAVVGYALATTFGMFLMVRDMRFRPSLALFKQMVAFGAPTAISSGVWLSGGLDRYLVSALTSMSAAGQYQLASIGGTAMEMGGRSILLACEPLIYRSGPDEIGSTLEWLLRAGTLLLVVASLGASLVAPELMALLAPPEYAPAAAALPWIAFGAGLHLLFRFFAFGLARAGDTRSWFICALVDVGVGMSLLAVFTPVWGIGGAGAMRMVGAVVSFLLGYALLRRTLPARLPVATVVAYVVGAALVSAWLVVGWGGGAAPLGVRAFALLAGMGVGWLLLGRGLLVPAASTRTQPEAA